MTRANMIDEGGNYVQTTTTRRALEDAIRDFVLHNRAVGSGQPKGYEDPDRTGNHLQRSATNTDYSHFRQFVMKEARKPLYQEMSSDDGVVIVVPGISSPGSGATSSSQSNLASCVPSC